MPAADLPIEPDRLPDAPHERVLGAARERREFEQLITDWERETRQLGHALALMTLDVSVMTAPEVGAPLHHRRQSSGCRELVLAFLWSQIRRALGAA
jgi:hypothetical protein